MAHTHSLQGGVALQVSRPLGPSPDGYQGWGRLSLRGTLPLRGYTHPDFALQLLDGGAFDRNNTEVVVGGVTATGTGCVGCRGFACVSALAFRVWLVVGGVTAKVIECAQTCICQASERCYS